MSTVIKVENLSKRYRLGVVNRDMLYKDLQSRWAKFRGKEDPNAPIGLKHDKRLEHGDEFWALRNVDLEVKEGEILGIIGRNGAGKSTLLKILSQITAPTEGKIKVKGRIASLLEVGTGFHPELTGRENVYLNGAILGMTRKEVRSKFDEIVAFAEIDEFIDTPVKRYSSGMYVRLAFAVAAHLDPEILIVDEVLAVGDVNFQKKCLGKMENVASFGRTILFVSHNLAAVKSICNTAIMLDQGCITLKESSETVCDTYINKTKQNLNHFYINTAYTNSEIHPAIRKAEIVTTNPTTFSNLMVKIRIKAPQRAAYQDSRYELAFGVRSYNGDALAQIFSKDIGLSFDMRNHQLVTINVKSLPLAPGSYVASLWLGRGHEPIHWIPEAFTFEVQPQVSDLGYTEQRGFPILLQGEWTSSDDTLL